MSQLEIKIYLLYFWLYVHPEMDHQTDKASLLSAINGLFLCTLWEVNIRSNLSSLLSLKTIFYPLPLTFPADSFLHFGVFVFLSFFIRSAAGAKYSGGKGIYPTHMQTPDFQMTTWTCMHTAGKRLQDNHIYKTNTHINKEWPIKTVKAFFLYKKEKKKVKWETIK